MADNSLNSEVVVHHAVDSSVDNQMGRAHVVDNDVEPHTANDVVVVVDRMHAVDNDEEAEDYIDHHAVVAMVVDVPDVDYVQVLALRVLLVEVALAPDVRALKLSSFDDCNHSSEPESTNRIWLCLIHDHNRILCVESVHRLRFYDWQFFAVIFAAAVHFEYFFRFSSDSGNR